MSLTVVERARRYQARCRASISGQGGHNSAYHVAVALVHGFALGETDALSLMREFNRRCVPPWREGELLHKLTTAANTVHPRPRGHLLGGETKNGRPVPSQPLPPPPPKPRFQPDVLKRVANNIPAVKDVVRCLVERSPVAVDRQDSASVLRHLYVRGSGEKVLLFTNLKSQGQFLWAADRSDTWQQRHLPAGADGIWFLPQPVDGGFFPNPRANGILSRRSEEAVTAFRYAVLESDEADADDWLRCLVQMPLRIASICESGGRSIHALVRLDAASKPEWDRLMEPIKPVLITLGADRGALSAVRLTRLPQAMRGARCQRLLYLNPQPDGLPIFQQPIRPAFNSQKL